MIPAVHVERRLTRLPDCPWWTEAAVWMSQATPTARITAAAPTIWTVPRGIQDAVSIPEPRLDRTLSRALTRAPVSTIGK